MARQKCAALLGLLQRAPSFSPGFLRHVGEVGGARLGGVTGCLGGQCAALSGSSSRFASVLKGTSAQLVVRKAEECTRLRRAAGW